MAMILCVGLDESLYSSARIEGQIDRSTEIVTLRSSDLPLTMAEIVSRGPGTEKSDTEENIENFSQAFVIFDGSKSSLDSVMKGFKRAYKLAAGSIIFALLTETARTWALGDYLKELSAEHREMGTLHEKK